MNEIKKNYPFSKKLNKSKSLIFDNNLINSKKPVFNYINKVENINLFNSNDKLLKAPWKRDENSNNRVQVRLNENNRYNNLNNKFNLPNKNILPKINLNLPFKNEQKFQINSNKNSAVNQIFLMNKITNKLKGINNSLKKLNNIINDINNNNFTNINNNNPLKNNAINKFDKNIIEDKHNQKQQRNKYSTLSTSKLNIPNNNANIFPIIGAPKNINAPGRYLTRNASVGNYITNINNKIDNNRINNIEDRNKIIIKKEDNKIDYLSILKKFLIKKCKIPKSRLDYRGDCLDGWRENDKSGPPGYLKDYIPPKGWKGVGLNVIDIYDNGKNAWLGRKKKKGEWYICYHGTRKKRSIKEIIENNFKPGPRQKYENIDNENPLNNLYEAQVGNGIYFAKDINDAKRFAKIIEYKEYKFRVVFMCRINPKLVKICNDDKYYVVSGDDVDNEVRPYRVLFHFE